MAKKGNWLHGTVLSTATVTWLAGAAFMSAHAADPSADGYQVAQAAPSAARGATPAPSAAPQEMEEIVVTSRLRSETLLQSPIALSAVTAQQIKAYDVQSLNDIANLAGGGVIIAITPPSDTLSIRGVSSDASNAGFDQSVGILIDGVFYNRGRWVQQGFLDMQSVEIAKGPQALYFGRNAVGGGLNIRTADPTDHFEAGGKFGYEFYGDTKYLEAYVSGPLTDTLSARLAFRADDQGGWEKNISYSLPRDQWGAMSQQSGRITLDWHPDDDFDAKLKVQLTHESDDGNQQYGRPFNCRGPSASGTAITGIPASQIAPGVPIGVYPITATCRLDDTVDQDRAFPGSGFPSLPEDFINSQAMSLDMTWHQENFDLTSITGLNHYNYGYQGSLVAEAGFITAGEQEKDASGSESLRLQSKLPSWFNFMVGFDFNLEYYSHGGIATLFYPLYLTAPDPRNGLPYSFITHTHQHATSYSPYTELQFDITDQLNFAAGVRFTDETKDSFLNVPFINQSTPNVFLWAPENSNFRSNFHDQDFSPQATLTWKPSKELMVYGGYREGYLPGGFSHGATVQAGITTQSLEFQSEKARGFEAGVKGAFLDRRLRFDLVGYRYNYSNLQVSLFVPATGSFITGNAGRSYTQGFEANTTYVVTPEFTARAGLTYNDAEYSSYTTACYTLQSYAAGCNVPTAAPKVFVQNMAGKPLQRAPEVTATIGGQYDYQINPELTLSLNADIQYIDDYYISPDDSPFYHQPSYFRVDANLTLASENGWRAAIIGRNLTDQAIGVFGGNRALTNDAYWVIQRLREVALEVSYKY